MSTQDCPSNCEIIFEDADILALNKPAGLHSTAINEDLAGTVLEYLSTFSHARKLTRDRDFGLVQRLDRETSGIVLVAKNLTCYDKLIALQKKQLLKKTYLALLSGILEKAQIVDLAIGSPYRRSKKVRCYALPKKSDRALPAQTSFTPLQIGDKFSLVKAQITQGRRHQIRAHASYLGHPLVGDNLYGATDSLGDILGEDDFMPEFLLIAYQLDFPHPINHDLLSLKAPIPDYCKRFPILEIA